jgi:murein L,D-transpeptidase YcbB/YkuD
VRVSPDGRASFFGDIYGLDRQMSSRLEATADSRVAVL